MKTIKNIIWNTGATIFFIWLAFKAIGLAADVAGVPSLCEYTHVAEFKSPEGNKIAKLGYSDCGATTNWQSGINILDVESGEEYRGMFGLDGKPDDLKIHWENKYTLVISNFPLENLLWFRIRNKKKKSIYSSFF